MKKIAIIFSIFVAFLGYIFLSTQNLVFAQTTTRLTLEKYTYNSDRGGYFTEGTNFLDDRLYSLNSTQGISLGYLATLTNDQNTPLANQQVKLINLISGTIVSTGTTDAQGKVAFWPSMNNEAILYAIFEGGNSYGSSVSNRFTIKVKYNNNALGSRGYCYYQNFDYQKGSSGGKSLHIKKNCYSSSQDRSYELDTHLNVEDSFSTGEVRDCTIGGTPQKCVLNEFKYYYSCSGSQNPNRSNFKCTHATYNSVDPDTSLSCTNITIDACSATSNSTACTGTSLKAGYAGGNSGTIVKTRKTNNSGNPIPGVDPIQISCFTAGSKSSDNSTEQSDLFSWQAGVLGYSSTENNRSSVYIVGCINDNDCKANEFCDTSGSWDQWACKHKEITRPVRVFVTQSRFTSGSIGGMSGADAKCAAEAASSTDQGDPLNNIPAVKDSKWKAWLSTSSQSAGGGPITIHAKDRISNGQYTLVDFTRIADSKNDLLSGNFATINGQKVRINKDKNGDVVLIESQLEGEDRVWTGTKDDGTISAYYCNGSDWGASSTIPRQWGVEGTFGSILGTWSNASNGNFCTGTAGCSSRGACNLPPEGSYRLYCFEDITPDNVNSTSACQTGDQVNDGLISAGNISGNFGNNIGVNQGGACVEDPKASFVSFKIPTYNDLLSLHFTQSKSGGKVTLPNDATNNDLKFDQSSLINIKGNLSIDGDPPSTASGVGVVFVDGNLNINQNYTYGKTASYDAAGTVFVVKGNVNIETIVREINGVIISQGLIFTAGAGCQTSMQVTSRQLVVNGSLISLYDPYKDYNSSFGNSGLRLCRVLYPNANNLPSEVINLQPKYLSILRNIFSSSIQKWTEIPGLNFTEEE